jgi:acyl carrier protein
MNSTPQGFETAILETIAELATVRVSEIKNEDRLREDLGLDSVSSMELLSMLAERFDLEIGIEEAVEINTVGKVIEIGRLRLAGRT